MAEEIQVHFALLGSQLLAASSTVLSQHVLGDGINQVIYSFYCCLAALVALVPISILTERGTPLQNRCFDSTLKLLLLGFIFFVSQILLMTGLKNTSSNFFTSMQPSIPVFGTAFAILMRVEKLNWPSREGQAKVGGIFFCCAGATVMALWKGPCIFGSSDKAIVQVLEFTPGWSFGVLCILSYCICTALNGCLVATLLAKYPKTPITITACVVAIATPFLGAYGIIFYDFSAWKISSTPHILSIGYNGVFAAGLGAVLLTWSIGQVGPILATCYVPVQPAASAVLSLIFLNVGIYMGSIFGASLIIAGLILISWSRETYLKKEPLLLT